jgi:DNA-binding MarR family transcriptional regulator
VSSADKIAIIQSELQAFSTHVYLFQQQVAEKMKLHPTDFRSVHLLDRHGAMTAGQLAALLGLTSGATTAAIDRLVELGYAERATSDTDRRSTIIRLRSDGMQKMRDEYSLVNGQVQDGLELFSDAELDIIGRFLRVLTES